MIKDRLHYIRKFCSTIHSAFLCALIFCALFMNGYSECEAVDFEAPISSDSRIKTFIYSSNEIFPIILNYGYQTSIEFGKGEFVQNYSLGNSYAWQISIIDNSMFMKPLEENIVTNMTIITNKRKYYFELVSKSFADALDEEMAFAIRFFYHDDEAAPNKSRRNIMISEVADSSIIPYNFDYTMSGDHELKPKAVFDDGIKTYFQYVKIPGANVTIKCMADKRGKGAENVRLTNVGNTLSTNRVCKFFTIAQGKKRVIVSAAK